LDLPVQNTIHPNPISDEKIPWRPLEASVIDCDLRDL